MKPLPSSWPKRFKFTLAVMKALGIELTAKVAAASVSASA